MALQITAAKAVHGQVKVVGRRDHACISVYRLANSKAATLRRLFVAPLLKNSLTASVRMRSARSAGSTRLGRQLIADNQKLK
jgi:hypothetical protein